MAAGRIVLSQYFPARDRNARLVSGALLYVYTNGTTTKASIFAEEALATPLANPVAANSSGQFPAIWASDAVTYTLSITASDGSSIGNPSVFDDYSVSTDADTAAVALAEAAAASAAADLAEILAIEASGDDAAAIAARAAKNANGSDFTDPDAVLDNLTITPTGTGAVPLALSVLEAQRAQNVRSYGAVGNGSANDTLAFQRAFAANLGKPIFIPPGTYRVGNVGGLAGAGSGMFGAAGYTTVIKPVAGTTGSLFYNPDAASSNFAYGLIRDLRFVLEGESCIAIDLSHCDTCVVERVNGDGNTSKANATGTLVKFGAPTDSSSYNNVVRDCAGQYFSKAIIFGENANQNRLEGGSFVLNDIAVDAAPGGVLLRPQIIGTRIEGNNIGVKEGAQGGVYLGYFEGHTTGDFSFTTDSDACVILPGSTTASTATPLHNRANASNLRCLSYDLGYFDIQESQSNTAAVQGRRLRTVAGATAVPTFPNVDATDIHFGTLVLGNGYALEGGNAAAANIVKMLSVNASDEVELVSYNRATAAYTPLNIGGGASVRPLVTNTTDLGTGARRFKDGYFEGNVFAKGSLSLEGAGSLVFINSVQVLEARGAAVANAVAAVGAPTQAEFNAFVTQFNALLDRLRPTAGHGLIEA